MGFWCLNDNFFFFFLFFNGTFLKEKRKMGSKRMEDGRKRVCLKFMGGGLEKTKKMLTSSFLISPIGSLRFSFSLTWSGQLDNMFTHT